MFPASATYCEPVFEQGTLRALRGNTRPIYRGIDYTDKMIRGWLVLGTIRCVLKPNRRNYQTAWLCQCQCGSEPQWVDKYNIITGRSRGCYACYGTRTSGETNGNWKGFGEISGEAFNRVRNGARERNIRLEVTISDLHDLWIAQNRMCALTGMPLVMGETASLDRIDSNSHYHSGNVQWVHKTINIMKNNFSEDEFIEMCCLVAKQRREIL